MSAVVIKNVEALGHYRGEHELEGIRFKSAGRQLGVLAWGMNVLEIAAGCELYPEHDHTGDGQQEVYVVLRGSGTLRTSEGEHALAAGDMALVPPEVKRKILPGPEGITVLAIGATPGKVFASNLG